MNELMDKMDNLIQALDSCEVVMDLKKLNSSLLEDSLFCEKIQSYHNTFSPEIREELIQNPTFLEYKHQENECNFLIMEINRRLKEIHDKGKCAK